MYGVVVQCGVVSRDFRVVQFKSQVGYYRMRSMDAGTRVSLIEARKKCFRLSPTTS